MTPSLTRRQLLVGGAGLGVLAATGGARAGSPAPVDYGVTTYPGLPDPRHSGLDHIVVVCMENRSFDHYLGWLQGADGRQAGLFYRDDAGRPHRTHRLYERTGCGFNDPDHSYSGGRTQLAEGRLDGFRKGGNDDFALGYYAAEDLPLYSRLVHQTTVFDRYFCSILGPTFPNRVYTHAAATDRLDNTFDLSTLPTIWDRLAQAGVSRRYYFSDEPVLALWGPKYLPISTRIDQFFLDAELGQLPAYSYVDPGFAGEADGTSNDDHPHADIHAGQALVSRIVEAVTHSPQWPRTALVLTYDEWGGFFEHVLPPRLPDDHDTGPLGPDDHGQAGFRVPTFVLSPLARRGYVGHNTYDHTSILKMVEWRFGLRPLTRRDAAARNLAESFQFGRPDLRVPGLPVVADPPPHVCAGPFGKEHDAAQPSGVRRVHADDVFWRQYAASPLLRGWR